MSSSLLSGSGSRLLLLVGVVVAALIMLGQPTYAQDPASSWLAYAQASSSGDMVTSFSAIVTVPSKPKSRGGYMAFWIGQEPTTMDDLFQPILALTSGEYLIWNEEFLWQNEYDYQSPHHGPVQPGDKVLMSLEYLGDTLNSYNLTTTCLTCDDVRPSFTNFTVPFHKTFTDIFVVLEHQNPCDCYPANGMITFSNITAAWDGVPAVPVWNATLFKPTCNAQVIVNDPTSVSFTFDAK